MTTFEERYVQFPYLNMFIKALGFRDFDSWRTIFWICRNWFNSWFMSWGVVPLT